MFDPDTAAFAANKVMRELSESGAVGRIERSVTKHTFELTASDGVSVFEGDYRLGLVEGNTYTVTLDSGKYTAAAKWDNDTEMFFIGNLGLAGVGDDTGESFLVAYFDGSTVSIVDSTGGSSCVISSVTKTIHPIDPKYLPGVCLPVVDLSSFGVGVAIDDATVIAQLENAYNTAPGILANVNIGTGETFMFCGRMVDTEGNVGFMAAFGTVLIVVVRADDGQWAVQMESVG